MFTLHHVMFTVILMPQRLLDALAVCKHLNSRNSCRSLPTPARCATSNQPNGAKIARQNGKPRPCVALATSIRRRGERLTRETRIDVERSGVDVAPSQQQYSNVAAIYFNFKLAHFQWNHAFTRIAAFSGDRHDKFKAITAIASKFVLFIPGCRWLMCVLKRNLHLDLKASQKFSRSLPWIANTQHVTVHKTQL